MYFHSFTLYSFALNHVWVLYLPSRYRLTMAVVHKEPSKYSDTFVLIKQLEISVR